MKDFALVGGDFSDTPKKSGLVDLLYRSLGRTAYYCNGGRVEDIPTILEEIGHYPVILWFPNISNEVEKMRNIKELYPHACLVTSKRNDDKKYSLHFLVNHALNLHANLCIEFVPGRPVQARLFDPLGNVWCDYTDDIPKLALHLSNRIDALMVMTRQSSIHVGDSINVPDNDEFFELVKGYAEVFHELVDPEKEVERFLGNTSFRCDKGFPSFRDDSLVFMSRRNIDKSYIDRNGFVGTKFSDGKTCYYGDRKPSVDTPIQVRLYQEYPNINFMIHSHCYIKDAPFTRRPIPCGALEEVDEILEAVPDRGTTLVYLNLVGHGSLVMSKGLDGLRDIPYITRPVPELFE